MFNSFYISNSFPITITTLIVLTVICFFLRIKKGVSAGIVSILIILLGYVVNRLTLHFTWGLDRIGYKLQRIMGNSFDIVMAIVIFVIVVAVLSLLSSFGKKKDFHDKF